MDPYDKGTIFGLIAIGIMFALPVLAVGLVFTIPIVLGVSNAC